MKMYNVQHYYVFDTLTGTSDNWFLRMNLDHLFLLEKELLIHLSGVSFVKVYTTLVRSDEWNMFNVKFKFQDLRLKMVKIF